MGRSVEPGSPVRLCAALVCALLVCAAPVAAQTVNVWSFEPPVLAAGGAPQVRLTVEISGQPTRVALEFNPGQRSSARSIELRDDGRDGDAVAGDQVYTAVLPAAEIVDALRSEDVQRVFVGFLDLFNGGTRAFRGNLFISIYTPSIGTWPVVRLSDNVQATSRLVNVALPGPQSLDLRRAAQEFYRSFGDDHDYLNIITAPARFENRVHITAKNQVDGIGLPRSDNTASYGSRGRLMGLSHFPIPDLFDGAESGYLHEFGHQWINFLNVPPLAQGTPHWPYSSMGGGVMGISIGGMGGQGGTFACEVEDIGGAIRLNPRPNAPLFNDLELYLMGLLPPEQVRPQWVFDDQEAARSLRCNGQVFSGAATRLTVQDVIARVGPRVPAADAAPKRWRVATVLVTRDRLASPEAMWLYSHFALRAEGRSPVLTHPGLVTVLGMPFHVATGGRATLDTLIEHERLYSIEGSAAGPPAARSLALTVRPAAHEVGRPQQVFVAALLGAQWFVRSPGGWLPWSGGPMPALASEAAAPAEIRLQVLDGTIDLGFARGARIYAGYGSDDAAMLAAGRYALVHVVE